jgi:hypothetical protein
MLENGDYVYLSRAGHAILLGPHEPLCFGVRRSRYRLRRSRRAESVMGERLTTSLVKPSCEVAEGA